MEEPAGLRRGGRLRRKQVLLTTEQERWLVNRARSEGRSESAVLRDLIDARRQLRVADAADPLDRIVGTARGRKLGTHDAILYGRRPG